jgi:glycosyltransferase involved in cell wall biosynthesis
MSAVLGGAYADAPAAPADTSAAAAQAAAPGGVPRLSVVVPTCRRPDLLLRCLRALQAQTVGAAAFEVIVVDDGRDDWTRTLIATLALESGMPDLHYLRPIAGRGPAVARNRGWRAARGDVVAFTDDDTVPAADWLARGEAAMRQGPWAALGGRVEVPLPRGRPPTDHERMTQGLERSEFVTANAFVRRAALHRVQGFDERYTRAWREDSDLQFRLLDEAGPVGRCETAVVLHPARAERWGVSLRQQKNAYYEALLFRKHPQRYRATPDGSPPWLYYGIVALTTAAVALAMADVAGSAMVSALLAGLLVLRLTATRLSGTTHRLGHVLEMLVTSALIPFLSVYWRLRGAWRWKVWFL